MFRTIGLYVDLNACQACPRCAAARACRQKALLQVDPEEPPFLEPSRCRDCWVCIPACPHNAIKKVAHEQ